MAKKTLKKNRTTEIFFKIIDVISLIPRQNYVRKRRKSNRD